MGRRKTRLFEIVETFWSVGFALGGKVAARRVQRWQSTGGQRIVVFAPHPDDEALGCAGTILLHKQSGDTVWVIYVSDGGGSRALGLSQQEMRHRRREESQNCALILGVDHPIWLDLPEYGWQVDTLVSLLRPLMEDIRPDFFYAPSCIDFHPEHKKVALALGKMINSQYKDFLETVVRVYQIHVPLTPVLTNLVVAVGSVMGRVESALECYTSQSGSMAQTRRLRRYAGKFYGISHQIEEFWALNPTAYGRIHAPRSLSCSSDDFKGLLPHPLMDPYIYVHGALRRRQTANLAKVGMDR